MDWGFFILLAGIIIGYFFVISTENDNDEKSR